MKNSIRIFSILGFMLLGACTNGDDLGPGKTGQKFSVSGHSYDQVWNASLKAVVDARGTQAIEVNRHPEITEQNKKTGVIKASVSQGIWSWGEVMGIFIDPTRNAQTYTINVESRTVYRPGSITSNNWEDEIIANIKQNLKNSK